MVLIVRGSRESSSTSPLGARASVGLDEPTGSAAEILACIGREPGVSTVLPPATRSSHGLSGVVRDPDGNPVVGARLECIRWEAALARDGCGPAVAEGASGVDGAFDLGLPPEFACILRARHSEWAATDVGPMTFRAGINLEVRLSRGWSVAGEVVDAKGHPVGSASITVSHPTPLLGGDGRWVVARVSSDALGRFATESLAWIPMDIAFTSAEGALLVYGLEPGAAPSRFVLEKRKQLCGVVIESGTRAPIAGARVTLDCPGGSEATSDADGRFAVTLFPGATHDLWTHAARHVPARTVARGDTFVEVELEPRPRVCGVVLLGDGSPAAGARLALRPSPAVATFADRASVDALGRFDWLVPASGSGLALVAELDGVGSVTTPEQSLRAGEIHDQGVLTLEDSAGAWGWVLDARGRPISAAAIELYARRDQASDFAAPLRSASSAPDGSYRLPFSEPGEWRLRAHAAGFSARITTLQIDHAARGGRSDFVLERGGAIEGRVVDEQGRAIAAVSVGRGDDLAIEVMTTDAGGRFRFECASSDPQVLVVHKDGSELVILQDVLPSPLPLEVVLRAGAVIRGVVVSAASGRPVRTFRVQCWQEGSAASAPQPILARIPRPFSSEDGTFELSGLAPGHHTLRIEGEGLLPWEAASVQAQPSASATCLQVQLESGAELAGQVVGPGGLAITGARVCLRAKARLERPFEAREAAETRLPLRLFTTTTSDAQGFFRLTGLRCGDVTIGVEARGFAPAAKSVVIPSAIATPTTVRIELSAATELVGRVWSQAGRPASSVTVFAQTTSIGNASLVTTRSDAEGFFRLEGVALGGEYRVVANALDPETGAMRRTSRTLVVDGPVDGLTLVLP